jgi:glutathione S-transferase
MQGQAAHFNLYAPTKIQYGIDRYLNETRRLYSVIEIQLAKSKSGFLVGDHISIADIAALSWLIYGRYTGVDMAEYPAIQKWDEMLSARPGISNGFHVPKDLKMKKTGYDPVAAAEYAKQASQWILKGMEEDSKK